MNELTGCEVRSLILGRRPAKHGVAMGMATEAGDDVAMAARLGCRKRIDLPQMLWRLVDQRLAKQTQRSRSAICSECPRGSKKKVFSHTVASCA